MILRRFFCLLPLLWASLAPAQTLRDLRDMAGDTVQVPARIERVATVGAVPVLNSLLFAIGKAGASSTACRRLPRSRAGATR